MNRLMIAIPPTEVPRSIQRLETRIGYSSSNLDQGVPLRASNVRSVGQKRLRVLDVDLFGLTM